MGNDREISRDDQRKTLPHFMKKQKRSTFQNDSPSISVLYSPIVTLQAFAPQ